MRRGPRPDRSVARTGGSFLQRFMVRPEAPALVFLAVLLVAFSLANDRFWQPSNLESIVASVAVLGVIALAVNQVVLAGEIDISTGSMLGPVRHSGGRGGRRATAA